MNQPSKPQITCQSCGSSNIDRIAPCKRFYRNTEILICDRCKDKGQWEDLRPIIWIATSSPTDGGNSRSLP